MNWKELTAAGLLVLGVISRVSLVGKSRKPITANEAALSVFLNAIIIWLILS